MARRNSSRTTRWSITREKGVVVLFAYVLSGGVLSAQPRAQQPAPPVNRPDPYQGLRSVVERAEQEWKTAHAAFRETLTPSNPCDPSLKRVVASAQAALEARTRAWNAYYLDRGNYADDAKKAAAVIEAETEAELRSQQARTVSTVEMIAELRKRRQNLEGVGAGLEGPDLAKAKLNLDEQISVRQQIVENSESTARHLKDNIRYAQATQRASGDDSTTARSFSDLITSQRIMYASLYRGRELRVSLECPQEAILKPPKPPR